MNQQSLMIFEKFDHLNLNVFIKLFIKYCHCIVQPLSNASRYPLPITHTNYWMIFTLHQR